MASEEVIRRLCTRILRSEGTDFQINLLELFVVLNDHFDAPEPPGRLVSFYAIPPNYVLQAARRLKPTGITSPFIPRRNVSGLGESGSVFVLRKYNPT